LTLVLVAALAVIGALAWVVVRGGSARGIERADNPEVEMPSEARTDVSAELQPLEARSAEHVESGAGSGQGASSSAGGTGTLRLRVLDEETRAPVPDLQFVVYRERGGTRELGRGRTDAQGRAEIHEVEANTVIVRTERKPPHAEQTGAVWLTAGSTKEVEILVGAGGTIVGRVIDDLERPVAGAALYLDQYSWGIEGFASGARESEARSANDGRFRIENLASRPGAVWIVDGQMRPEGWSEVYFNATLDNVSKGAKALPLPGKDVDAGDIVLERAATYSGRVFDPNGRTVAGALLSLGSNREYHRLGVWKRQPELAIGPGQPNFRLLPGEVLTNAAGEFEIHATAQQPWVIVWTPDDLEQGFGLQGGKPGERVDGIELKLELRTRVELELVDAAGAAARVPPAGVPTGRIFAPWRSGFAADEDVLVHASTSEGKSTSARSKASQDGKWRFELRADPAAIAKLEVWASGYDPIVEESATGFPPLVRRRLELAAFPSFRVRLVSQDPAAKLLDAPGAEAHLHVCMADPARHARGVLGCCGLGVHWNGPWRGEPLALTLPVRRKGAFWIYASARHQEQYADIASIGPFEPGAEERVLTVDPASFVTEKQEERTPPDPSAPGDEHRAMLRARVVDARTGAALPGAYVQLTEIVAPPKRARGTGANADENGDIRDAPVSAGRWLVSATAGRYKRAEIGECTTRAGETLELGTIGLDPQPLHRGKLVAADGKPPSGRGWLTVLTTTERGEPRFDGLLERGGGFELVGELPPKLVLQAGIFGSGEGREFENQRFLLEPWPEDEVKELRFAPSRRVLVTVLGVDPDESELGPNVCPVPGEPTALCDHRLPLEPQHQPLSHAFALDRTASMPRYAFLLAPGRYQIWGSNLMHELPATELEVAPGDGDIELTITAH
jgi:protocatechuate 3,4-dioxygenase beta subunit